MRILRLDFVQGQSQLDLHPFVTVARELSAPQLDELLEMTRGLARGSAAGIRGLVQNQGLLVDLDGFGNDRLLSITGANVVIDCDAAGAAGIPGLQAQIDQMQRRAEIDAVVVEEIRADLSPAARAKVADLSSRLTPIDAAALASREAENQRVIDALRSVASIEPTITEALPEVIALRQQWEDHRRRLAAAEDHFAGLMNAIKQSETRLAKARQGLEIAEEEAKPVLLTREEETRLEQLCFPEQDESRKGRWRKMLRPEEETERDELFARVGLDSWTAYTLYRAHPTSTPERLEVAEKARNNVAEAEATLYEVRERLSTDEVTAKLNDEADAIRAACRPHLGQLLPADLGQALNELVVQRPNPAWRSAVESLHEVLVSLGAPIGDGATVQNGSGPTPPPLGTEVVQAAETWLDDRRREAIDVDHDVLQAELDVAAKALQRHDRALLRIQRAEQAAMSSAARLDQLEKQMAARLEGGPKSLDSILNLIGPVVSQIELEARGSVPLAVLGQFADLHDHEVSDLMDELRRMAERLQIIVVSDHPAATAWATTVGMENALVVRPKPQGRATLVVDS